MKVTIKFHVLLSNGRKKTINRTYDDCPDFSKIDKTYNVLFDKSSEGLHQVTFCTDENQKHTKTTYTISIEEQIDEWIESLDKSNFMYDNDVSLIFNWTVISYSGVTENSNVNALVIVNKKPEKLTDAQMIELFFRMNPIQQRIIDDFQVVYKSLQSNFKGIKWDKQIAITFDSMGIAYKSASTALTNLSNYGKSLESVKFKDHYKNTGNDNFEYDMDAIHKEAKDKLLEHNTEQLIIQISK